MLFNLRLHLQLLLIESRLNNNSEAHESSDSSTAPRIMDGPKQYPFHTKNVSRYHNSNTY